MIHLPMIHFDSLLPQILGALLIGEEIFVIAALWPLSEWASARTRGGWLVASLALALGCIALYAHAMLLLEGAEPLVRTRTDGFAAALAFPVFLAFPAVICTASAQSLRLAGVVPNVARAVSLVVAALATVAAPLAAMAVGCGLAGMCA